MSKPATSDRVVIQAPMSFTGSAKRIWHLTWVDNTIAKIALGTLAVFLIMFAWMFIACWYLCFGIFLWPYRLLRRGSRSRKQGNLRHGEVLQQMAAQQQIIANQQAVQQQQIAAQQAQIAQQQPPN